MSLSHGGDEVSGVLQALSGAEELHVLGAHVLGGFTLAVVAVLQHEHGGPVLLGPLVPGSVVQPARVGLGLPPDVEEGEPLPPVDVQVLPVPLGPPGGVGRVEMVSDLVMPLLREGLASTGRLTQALPALQTSQAGAGRDHQEECDRRLQHPGQTGEQDSRRVYQYKDSEAETEL